MCILSFILNKSVSFHIYLSNALVQNKIFMFTLIFIELLYFILNIERNVATTVGEFQRCIFYPYFTNAYI